MSTERVALVREVPMASTTSPLMDGTASYGSGNTYARGNHRHPTDTSRQAALSSAQLENIAAVPNKVDKVAGKGLSTEDYTYADKTKLGNLKPYTIPYGALNSTSTATVMTVTVSPPVTALEDGLCVLVKNGVITSAANFTINVNGLGAKPVYNSLAAATRETTVFAKGYTVMLFYDSTRVAGGCWVFYRGYDSDADILAYRIRGNAASLTAAVEGHKGRLWFTSADGTQIVPSNTSTVEDATSSRAVCEIPIDPFGQIWYYSTSGGVVPQGSKLSPTYAYLQYNLGLGYAFNDGALSLTADRPVYVKCAPLLDGSAVLQGIEQELPAHKDGYIYIYLGIAYDATHIEMYTEHPVYWNDGNGIKRWIGSAPVSTDELNYAMGLDPAYPDDQDQVIDDSSSSGTGSGSGSGSGSGGDGGFYLHNRAIDLYQASDGASMLWVTVPRKVMADQGARARDFILDVDNSQNSSDLSLEFNGLGDEFAFVVPDGTDIAEMTTVAPGEMARFYFSESALLGVPGQESGGEASSEYMTCLAMHRQTMSVVFSTSSSS